MRVYVTSIHLYLKTFTHILGNTMSDATSSDGEWKTVRISAPTYHKLLELSGFMTLITLMRTIPLSTIAEWAITSFYDKEYPRLKASMSDPKKRDDTAKEIGLGLKRVYDARDEWKALLQDVERMRKRR